MGLTGRSRARGAQDKSSKDKSKKIDVGQEKDLIGRTFDFSIRVLKLIEKLPPHQSVIVVTYQLSKSATSIGAN